MKAQSGDRATQRGQGLVELALVLPMILLIFFGAVDFGRAIFTYSTASEAARQAARLGIVDQTVSDVKARAISSAPTLNLTTSNVDVCFKISGTLQRDCSGSTDDCSTQLQIGCLVVVVVRASYSPLTPVISSLISSRTIPSSSLEPIEYVCPTATRLSCP